MNHVCFSGEDQGDVREPDAGRTPQHCQIPQVLAGHEGQSSTGMICFVFSPLFLSPSFHARVNGSPSSVAGHLHHRVHVVGQPQAVSEEDQEEPQDHECEGQ